jgi:predicted deacylase
MQARIQTIPLRRLSSGDDLYLQVYQFIGKKSGSKTYIQANLHGAEIVGNIVIKSLMDWLGQLNQEQLKGEIWLVPACNPVGMNQRSHFFASGRYNSYDGKDWNRIFGDDDPEEAIHSFAQNYFEASLETIYETYLQHRKNRLQEKIQSSQQARGTPFVTKYQQILQSLCLDATHVIDIHSSSNQGIDYLFTFPGQQEKTNPLLFDLGILVEEPEGQTFDEAFITHWLSLQQAFAKLGREINFGLASWTLELGSGMTVDDQSVEKGVKGIKNFLASQGIVKVADFPLPETEHQVTELVTKNQINKYYAPTGGIIQSCAKLKAEVAQGDIIYQILQFNKQGDNPQLISVKAEHSGFVFDVGTNQSVNEGEYVLTLLERGGNNDQ